jgi:GYD domain
VAYLTAPPAVWFLAGNMLDPATAFADVPAPAGFTKVLCDYVIVDLPDNAAAAAASMAVGAAGGARNTTVVLITAEEMDEVSNKNTQAYVPPRA